MFVHDLVALLIAKCGSLVSDSAGDRVFPNQVPPKVKRPLIRYQQTSGEPVSHMTGRTDSNEATFQLECQADTYDEAKELAASVVTAFDGCPKQIGSSRLKMAFVTDQDDQFEPHQSGRETGIHKVNVTVKLVYQ